MSGLKVQSSIKPLMAQVRTLSYKENKNIFFSHFFLFFFQVLAQQLNKGTRFQQYCFLKIRAIPLGFLYLLYNQ